MQWMEISLVSDVEATEIIVEILHHYVYQGAAIEPVADDSDMLSDDLPSAGRALIRAYILDNGHSASVQKELDQELRHLSEHWPITDVQYKFVDDGQWWEKGGFDTYTTQVRPGVFVCPPWAAR